MEAEAALGAAEHFHRPAHRRGAGGDRHDRGRVRGRLAGRAGPGDRRSSNRSKVSRTDKVFAAVLAASLLGLSMLSRSTWRASYAAAVACVGAKSIWKHAEDTEDTEKCNCRFSNLRSVSFSVLSASSVLSWLRRFAQAADKVSIALNWVPEPEFGGILRRAARPARSRSAGLDVESSPAARARRRGRWSPPARPTSASPAPTKSSPPAPRRGRRRHLRRSTRPARRGSWSHAVARARNRSTRSSPPAARWRWSRACRTAKFLKKKYGFDKVKRVPYNGGIAQFPGGQGFRPAVLRHLRAARREEEGGDPQTFLIADAGYNPYTGVVITRGEF